MSVKGAALGGRRIGESSARAIFDELYKRVGFVPSERRDGSDGQKQVIECDKRFIIVAGGDQSGKSMLASKVLLKRQFMDEGGLEGEEPLLYWLIAADYNRTRREFEYIASDFGQLGMLAHVSPNVDPGYILLKDGTRIETKSAKDPRTIAMYAPNGIIGCEASQLDLETYERIQVRLAPKRGWFFGSGSFESSLGWYPALHAAWKYGDEDRQSFSIATWTNSALFPGGRRDPEIVRQEREQSDQFFMERIAGKPMPPRGLVFDEFRPDLHVRPLKWIPKEPVYLWVDPGYSGAHAVMAVQIYGGQVRVFDEIYEIGKTTSDVIDIVKNPVERPWHVDVKFGVIDVAGYQHQAMAAPAEVWLKEYPLYMSSNKVRINEGIERMKTFLKVDPVTGMPKIVFDHKCKGALSEFGAGPNPHDHQTRAYRWKMDREGNVVGDIPEDRNNHAVKACIYGLVDRFGFSTSPRGSKILVKRW